MSGGQEVFTSKDLALLARGDGPLSSLHPPARLAVLGDPVAHSVSPQMHTAALEARGIDFRYIRLHVGADELPDAVRNLRTTGFLGASLTIPHKRAALPLMDEVTREARLMGAMNTVVIRDGILHGHNTDGPGLSAAITESFGQPLSSLRVLILGGAGGAGRAITFQCALESCPAIAVANRNRAQGDFLTEEIHKGLGRDARSVSLDPSEIRETLASSDLVINATPLGMKAGDPSPLPDGLLEPRHLVYDTVYSGGETSLLKQAQAAGVRCADGFSMLLHQGALQNTLWFGEPAPLEVMREALKTFRH